MEVLSLWLCSEGVNLKLGMRTTAGSGCTACGTKCNLKLKRGKKRTGLGGEVAVVGGKGLAKPAPGDYSDSKTDFKETELFILQ